MNERVLLTDITPSPERNPSLPPVIYDNSHGAFDTEPGLRPATEEETFHKDEWWTGYLDANESLSREEGRSSFYDAGFAAHP